MKISLADHGLYYKGLLILIRTDRKIDTAEREMMLRIGKALGFEKTFCEQAIREILDNEHIADDPPHFSNPEIARFFIRDGVRVALADKHIDDSELAWLKSVADVHNLDDVWFTETVTEIERQAGNDPESSLEATRLRWH